MQKTFLALLFLIVCLSSCTDQNQAGIPIFNNVVFNLGSQEKITPLDSAAEHKFRTYFNNQVQNQIPLLKHIKHPDYELFIGLPYNTTFARLKQGRSQNSSQAFSCADNFCTNHYHRDSLKITEYLYQASDQSLIFIAALTPLSHLPDSLFSAAAMKQRLRIKE